MKYCSFSQKNVTQAVNFTNKKLTETYLNKDQSFALKKFMQDSYKDLLSLKKADGTKLMSPEKAFTFVKCFPQLLTIAATTNRFKKVLRPNIAEIYDLEEALEGENSAETLKEYLGLTKEERSKEDKKALEELWALIPDEKPVNLDEVFGRKKTDLNKVDTPTGETINYKRLHRQEIKRGFNQITYCIDYVPVNRNIDTSPEILESRNFIYSFKNGKFNQDHKTALELLINRTCYTEVDGTWIFKRSTCILPVPASTHIKNINRYKDFLAAFCMNKKNIINGFEFIQLLFDREAKHTSETRESKVNYKIDLTSISKLGNVDIIVFDDLVTQGSTISQFLNELGGHKNKVKQIITLGATV